MASELIDPTTLATFSRIRAAGGVTTAARIGYLLECRTLAGAVAITAPVAAGLPDGTCFAVEDTDGNAAANNITIAGGATLIDGAATLVLSSANAVAILVLDGGQWRRVLVERTIASSPNWFGRAAEQPGGGATSVTMGGDVTGLSSACTVVKVRGVAVSAAAPAAGQALIATAAAAAAWSTDFGAQDLATTGAILFGATPRASVGLIRFDAAARPILAARNPGDTNDLEALSMNASGDLYVGSDTGNDSNKQWRFLNLYASSIIYAGIGGSTYLAINSGTGANEMWKPLTGSATASSPYGAVDGQGADVAMANANAVITSANYCFGLIKVTSTPAFTANRTLSGFPHPATNDLSYCIDVWNAQGGAFGVIISTGTGTTATVPVGTIKQVWITPAGAGLAS